MRAVQWTQACSNEREKPLQETLDVGKKKLPKRGPFQETGKKKNGRGEPE